MSKLEKVGFSLNNDFIFFAVLTLSKGNCFRNECTTSKESVQNIKVQILKSGCLESANKIVAYKVVLFIHMVE